jgi:hypothetical protein
VVWAAACGVAAGGGAAVRGRRRPRRGCVARVAG